MQVVAVSYLYHVVEENVCAEENVVETSVGIDPLPFPNDQVDFSVVNSV